MYHPYPFKFIAKLLSPQAFIMLTILLLATGQYHLQAQPNEDAIIQELEQDIASGKFSDDEIFSKYEWLLSEYSYRDREKTKICFQNAIAFAQEKKNPGFEAHFFGIMGYIYHYWDENDSAFLYFDKAVKLVENKELHFHESNIYGMMGAVYNYLTDSEKAMDNFLKALDSNEKDKIERKASNQNITVTLRTELNIINNLAIIYYNQFNYDVYLEYLLRAKKVMDDNPTVGFGTVGGSIIRNIAQHYIQRNEAEKALPFLEQGHQMAVKNNDTKGLINVFTLYADYYRILNDTKTQLHYAKEALRYAEKTEIVYFINQAEMAVMGAYYGLRDYKSTIYYGERILLRVPEEDWLGLKIVYSNLMMSYAFIGDHNNAEIYLENYNKITEKMSDKNLQSTIKEMEVKYDVQHKELEITNQQAEIDRQRTRQIILIGGLIGAGALVVLLIYVVTLRTRRARLLSETNATKDKFFTIISHDLKNPAVAQRDAIKLLLENSRNWNTEEITNYYQRLLKSSNDHVELLYTLLNWAQVQAGRLLYQPTLFDLNVKLKPDIDIIKNLSNEKGIIFNIQMPDSVLITGSYNMLTTVIRNLLVNAVKFTEKGGNITLSVEPAESGKYIISVTDTGSGMSAEQISKLFRLESAQSRLGTAGEQGSGLGLIVCKEFLEKHGSELYVESEEGRGSRFWFGV